MRFRHLDYVGEAPIEDLGPAAIDDLLERGDLASWAPLAAAVRRHPRGRLADSVLGLCAAHPMYGTSALWRSWIERLRAGDPEAEAPLTLAALRRKLGLTQEQVAKRMGIAQSDVSKLERRGDVRLSTLRAYLEAAGARLSLVAKRPDGEDLGVIALPGRAKGSHRILVDPLSHHAGILENHEDDP